MPRKVFVANEILTASDVNTNLMDQSVMVFDDATARTTAIPTPVEGMVTYLKDTDRLEQFDGSAFVGVATPPAILQVVSTTKTDTFTTTTAGFVDVTGLAATITPGSATSKVFCQVSLTMGPQASGLRIYRVQRNGTPVGVGTPVGSRSGATGGEYFGNADITNQTGSAMNQFLDTPASTAALTYQVQIFGFAGGQALHVNRNHADPNAANIGRYISTVTLIEVAG